jgi:dTDP-4-dehydrorhamnose 3,5-epimerase
MDFQETGLPGCYTVQARRIADSRGSFTKTFHVEAFEALRLRTDWREDYHSSSRRGVLRGMHFQTPPADHAKLVFCLAGSVRDVVLDLRRGSPTFGEHRAVELNEESALGLYIPTGCAHGFISISDSATLYYKVTSTHSAEHDSGILWNSFGCDWPVEFPHLSDRDRTHPAFHDFETPFLFDPANPAR